ncbi:MAG: hypothetical protein ACYDAC_02345 [Candidatus Dormibacteria bacterium]
MPSIRHRTALRLAAALAGLSSITAGLSVHAATPSSQDVGTSTSGYPTSVTWTGGSLAGNPDPLGPPAPTCSSGCDRETFTLHAPGGFTATHKINVTATATFTPGAASTTVDIAILDGSNSVLAQSLGYGSPASVTAHDLLPGTYVVEVDGDIGGPDTTSYNGALSVGTSTRTAQLQHASDGGITGSRETVADPFRLGTEPTINISPDGTVYTGPIFGFSTTQSFVMRSDDGAQTFNTLGVPGVGKPNECPGGGDEDLATDPNNNLYFLDLGGAPVVPASVSPDHGNTFVGNCVANQDANKPNYFPDRQWLSTDTKNGLEYFIWRDGLVSTTTPTDPVAGPVYGEYIETAPLAGGPASASQLVFTDLCKNPAGVGIPCISDLSIAGNAITDNSAASPHYGTTYLAMSRGSGVSLAIINPTATPAVTEVTTAPGAGNVLFPTVAVDRAGNIYEAYVDSSTYQVMFTRSIDGGATWSKPIVVNGAPAAVTVMPWIVAGDPGRVDIVYYGSPATAAPTTNSGPWNVYLAQDLNAASATPSFADWTQAQVSDRPNHVEPVCLSGLGCTTNTGPGGDRELGDFFKVALDSSGRAVISFADGNNKVGAEVASGAQAAPSFTGVLRQATGPSLYASVGNVPAIALPTSTVSVPSSHTNHIPFASPAGPGPSDGALTLLSSTTSNDGTNLHIHLVVKNLDTTAAVTPPALATATYLTRWWYGGQIYDAAAELNGGQWRFFAGQAAPVTDGLAIKYAYYPSTTAITGTVVTGSSGTIDLTVPVTAVGSPAASDTLYSVTSYALTHASPTAPTPPTASNFTDFPQVADVLPAYNTASPAAGLPEAPWSPALIVLGAALIGVATYRRRRAAIA